MSIKIPLTPEDMRRYAAAQNAARTAMDALHEMVRPGMSEKEIEDLVIALMVQNGSDSWWYHGVGALVLLGDRSKVSVGGREYHASETNLAAENEIITVDLAPTIQGYWGDYARTIFLEGGKAAPQDRPSLPEHRRGLEAELHLHEMLMQNARPDSTLEEIFFLLNEEIDRIGFVNLDYKKNLGHTIEWDQADRVYIEKGSQSTFAELGKPFTLEPHIAEKGGSRGFKRENIYYFEGDQLRCL